MSERDEFKTMFEDAVHDMSAIDEALGIDPDEAGGAEPILSAIEELKAERDALRADAERLDFLDKWAVIRKPGEPIRAAIDRERAAIAARSST